jgi:Mor family transcriptional regulator
MAEPKPKGLTDFVSDLLETGSASLVARLGVDRSAARDAMLQIAEELLDQYQGNPIYVPMAFGRRNAEIARKYSETRPTSPPYSQARIKELAAEFRLTSRQIYNVIAARRAILRPPPDGTPPVQTTLPGLDQP